MMVPYQVYSHFSIQQSFVHIDELVKRAYELKLPAIALTDKHSLSGIIEFHQEVGKINKNKEHHLVPILGCEFNIQFDGDNKVYQIILLAQNKNGWQNLIKILGKSYLYEDTQVVNAKILKDLSNGLIAIALDQYPINILTWFENAFGLNEIKTNPVYYVNKEDSIYLQMIICSKLKLTLADKDKIINEHPEYAIFFQTDEFYLKESIGDESSLKLLPLIEEFSIAEQPRLPIYCDTPNDNLRQECREGWKLLGLNQQLSSDSKLKEAYVDRIKMELGTFEEFNLSNYMLIIMDIARAAKKMGAQVGLRGSASGCLVSYLIGITDIDSMIPDPTLPYNPEQSLMFSRFINKGRLNKDNISLPDCDLDVSISYRDRIIEYIKEKYGADKVAHIVTFHRMDGRGAIKEVFRVLNPVENSFEVANIITSYMVDTAKVQDVLEDLKEDNPKYTVINYCIDNIPEINAYYQEYKKEFDVAIKLSNTIRNAGKHAAGIVVADKPLREIFPISIDSKTNEPLVALEMADAEYVGCVKFDILGVAAMEKIDRIIDMVNNDLKMPVITSDEISED